MIYLSSFALSSRRLSNPNIYPYSVFADKDLRPFVFAPITVLYGNNGCGKSTILNMIANKLNLKGKVYANSNQFRGEFYQSFIYECDYSLTDDEKTGQPIKAIPAMSMYIKSEDILYSVKKIEQQDVLEEGLIYNAVQNGMSRSAVENRFSAGKGFIQKREIMFGQEKYSNGETAIQIFEQVLEPDTLYLLDEPEVSLSPQNQVKLAEYLNKMVRLLGCQFIIATHSPFMIGTFSNVKIYNLDTSNYSECKWSELENVRYFYNFFKTRRDEFE
ncbi:MAG: AAA family ATPase [Spirochaetales bacterium]|nr:AAA family ATPase [Spirochaetales bacterium]